MISVSLDLYALYLNFELTFITMKSGLFYTLVAKLPHRLMRLVDEKLTEAAK